MFWQLNLRTPPVRAGITSSLPHPFLGCPQRPSSTLKDLQLLAGATVPPSGKRQRDPGCHGRDPSLEEVLSEAGVAIQHQCEPDSASTPGL